jgi:hypothetical protein
MLLEAIGAWLVEPPVAGVLYQMLSTRENVGTAKDSSKESKCGAEAER